MSNAITHFKGTEVALSGAFPAAGDTAPDFKVVASDLSEVTISSFKGKKVVLNTFPSVDTGVCAMQLKSFSKLAAEKENVELVFVSQDLPFAFGRFCGSEGIENATTCSDFRYAEAGEALGVKMTSGPLTGLLARSVLVLDEELKVVHSELVSEVTDEPDYSAAMNAL